MLPTDDIGTRMRFSIWLLLLSVHCAWVRPSRVHEMLFELATIDAQRHRNIPMPHLSSYTKQTQVRIPRNINAYHFSGNLLNAFFFGAPLDNLQSFRQFSVSFIISTH